MKRLKNINPSNSRELNKNTMKELQELRNEVLNLRNIGELTKQTESTLLHKLNNLKEQLILPVVVSALCECKKHSIKTSYGFEICTKCGNEFDD